jgi:hypothetical protein
VLAEASVRAAFGEERAALGGVTCDDAAAVCAMITS